MDFETLIADFRSVVPAVEFWSLRLVLEERETLSVRAGVVQPPRLARESGAHITLVDRGGVAYGATGELTRAGLRAACERAVPWLELSRRRGLFDAGCIARPTRSGDYASPLARPWDASGVEEKLTLLMDADRRLAVDAAIVDRQAYLGRRATTVWLLTSDGVEIRQQFDYLEPGLAAVANKGAQTQVRSGGGLGNAFQGGLERLAAVEFPESAERTAEEALALLDAPECPTATASLLLTPDQMMLQIHESIGHPLELDRILGDERNYAGTSFVTREMFGNYRYGSELLNVTFDPGVPEEAASYAFDDDGTPAERTYLIRDGLLERPLGGVLSQARAGMEGVANSRACAWNRPAIDRMANLNLEPGASPLDELVGAVEFGVLMETNRSWSIDDSRNKFQFGCEYARLIEDGEIKGVVRNPGYRGVSATFWRNLSAVGAPDTFRVHGVSNCGKGEPAQSLQTGHACPACVFRNVDVFGGS